MKKQKATKLRLNRETLRSLEESSLNAAGAAVVAPGTFLGCTNVVSDCYACTGKLDTCPQSRDCTIAVA